jgi:cbb3-type cytochrome oxidase maturation protein
MNVLLILVPLALFIGLLALGAFFWAMRSNQFEDPEGSARRILSDDDVAPGAPERRASGENNTDRRGETP